jgi:hypothetical protein
MKDDRSNGWYYSTQVGVYVGAALFLVALLVTAIYVPDLRILHACQALLYIAIIVLVHRRSPWGYGAGFAIAIVWNGMGLFVTHLIQAGAVAFWSWLRTGHAQQLLPMMVALGGLAHFVLIAAAVFAVARHNTDPGRWWKSAGGGLISVMYFAVLVAVFQPH